MTAEMDRRIARPSWGARRLAVIGGGVALAVVVAAVGYNLLGGVGAGVRVPAAEVTIDTVRPGVFHDSVVLRGKATPKDVIYLDALEGGQVEKVMALAGDSVAAGQPLVQFRNTQLELDVLDREGRLVESITQLQSYEKQLEDTRLTDARTAAEIDYNIIRLGRADARREQLLAKGFLAPEQRDQVRDELDYNRRLQPLQAEAVRRQDALARTQTPQVETELANLRESLKITRATLDDLIVKAPAAGRLTDMTLYAGQIVAHGERLGQIVPATGFKLQAQVDEYYLDRVRPGQAGQVEADGRQWPLRVTRVDPQVKDATFQIDLAFDGPAPPDLLPGEALDGKLNLGGDRPALILPAGAFLERSGGDWVMVVDAVGDAAVRRRIKLGRRNADQVEVLAGLKPGERVITSDYTGFEKVDRVALTK